MALIYPPPPRSPRKTALLHTLLRFLTKLVLAVFGLVFGIAVLAAALVLMLLGLVTSLVTYLLTGKRPAPRMAFGRFAQFSARSRWAAHSSRSAPSPRTAGLPEAQVVDVEVREIQDVQPSHDAHGDKRPP